MGTLVSVNIGDPVVQPGSAELTGIVKTPRTGPVMVDAAGLLGDSIMDKKHHGGPDQAVYLYLMEDYDWWMEEVGGLLAPGTFGENLTIDGIDSAPLAIGDRLAIGDVLLEVTWHRTPCATLGRRMRDMRWVKRFQRANRPGAYTRVLSPGFVEAGMRVDYLPYSGERVTVRELMSFDGVADLPPDLLRRALATPIRQRSRAKYEALL